MKTNNEDFTAEDILVGLYKLAFIGAGKLFNIDLDKLEKASGRKLKLTTLMFLAKLAAETPEEVEFVRTCSTVLNPQEEQ